MTVTMDKGAQAMPKLSPRQEACLRGVLELKSAKEIARDLGISPHAVEKHLRVSREKYGVASSAEAARLFAFVQQGSEFPPSDVSDLPGSAFFEHQRLAFAPGAAPSMVGHEGNHRVSLADQPLRPRQTLLIIFAISFGSIVGLALLIAVAEGVRRLVSG
jgi:DNA-binding CsgD family transcriptional regulator